MAILGTGLKETVAQSVGVFAMVMNGNQMM